MNRDQLVEQALSLAPADRAYLADALEQSLSSGGFSSPEVAAAWAVEVDRRLAAYDRGEIAADEVSTSLARLRRQLAERRAGKAAR